MKKKREVLFMKIPRITGEYRPLFRPERYGNYVNDHSIVRDAKGMWHLFGITSFTGGAYNERYFVHGGGASLTGEFAELSKVIDRGTLAWSPGVILREDGQLWMMYGPSPTMLSVSPDGNEWFCYTPRIEGEPPQAVHRDHFVMEVEPGKYLMYVTGVCEKRGCISVLSSENMTDWKFLGYALTTGERAPLCPAWGATESPYVVKHDGLYYLFVTYTDCSAATYNDTLVFVSEDPLHFGCYMGDGEDGVMPITKVYAHAPEIIEEDGQMYITTCGWNGAPNPNPGCVSIAPLVFE